MKASTTSTKNGKNKKSGFVSHMREYAQAHPRFAFLCQVAGFYGMLMILYLYFMMANLSSAPKFVYTAF